MTQAALLPECVETGDLEPARGRPQRGRQDPEQRRLPGAVVAEHRHVLTRVDDEVDAFESEVAAEPVREAVCDEHAHGCSGGVLRRGQSTNGPTTNSSSVATMIAIATPGA
jgi:hypothetical protein